MNALQSLTTGNKEEAYNTTALLKSTHEVEERIQEVYRSALAPLCLFSSSKHVAAVKLHFITLSGMRS